MAERGLSRAEFIRRRRESDFVGRRGEVSAFQVNLEREPGDEGFEFLFHVHGIAGVGKTSLVRQWDNMARDRYGAMTAFVDDDVHSAVEAMAAVSEQLSRQGCALKGFEKLLATYHQRRHEAETSAVGADGQESSASVSSTVVTQVGLAGLGMMPGMGPFTSAVDAKQLAQGADRLRVALSSRFRSHDDAQLVLSPLRVLTPVFVRELAEVAQRVRWMVLFFDTFEQTGPVLDGWLRDLLVEGDYGSLPLNVIVVLSGQGRLDARCWGECLGMIAQVPLDVFTEDEARQLLAAKGINDERLVEVILEISGRLPVLVDTLAQARPRDPEAIGDPADSAVERFLKWIPEPAKRAAVLACALPLHLNEDIYRAAVGELQADGYPWLRSLPFFTDHAGRCRYHQVVRGQMLRVRRAASPTQWSSDHTRLADAFQQWRETLETTLPADSHWDDPHWRDLRLNQTYHRLCAHPSKALPDALHEIAQACDHGQATQRRWIQTLTQAGQDTGANTLTQLGHKLQDTEDDDASGVIPALSLLLGTQGITTATRALAHAIRGREYRNADAYEAALADFDAALVHAPDLVRALAGRGMTYELTGRYDDALTDFNRAVELDPDNAWNYADRGAIFRQLSRLDDALADFNRAIELDPDNAWAIADRGETYRLMSCYDDALADLNRAIELNPDNGWAIAERGETYQFMSRFDDALADFNRANELHSESWTTLARRGRTYRSLRRYDDALADFNRANELNPNYGAIIADRGETYRLMSRFDDALADLNRAIEIDPDYAWAITRRGETYRLMDRHNNALADFNRAIQLVHNYAWAIELRGQTHRALGHYDDALADLNRAIELNPDSSWTLTQRGLIYRSTHRYDKALHDYNRAIQLDSGQVSAFASRAETYHALKRYDDALADLDHAIEIDPDNGWAIALRGQIHRALGHYDDALADLNRAIEIDPDSGWALYERAVVLRSLGSEGADACFQRAAQLFMADAAGDGPRAADANGNLLVVLCGLPNWHRAQKQVEEFFSAARSVYDVKEVLIDLAALREALPVDEEQLGLIESRLEEALAQMS